MAFFLNIHQQLSFIVSETISPTSSVVFLKAT